MSYPDDSPDAKAAHEIDYRETSDVTHVHSAIQREKKEPLSGSVPIPLWMMAMFGIVICWGSFYFGQYNGGFSGSVFDESAGAASAGAKKGAAGQGAEAAGAESVVDQGKKIFLGNCATCHQPTGLGVPGQYPPLAKSEYVNGGSKRLSMILLKGLQGPLKVEGGTFNGSMPTWFTLNDKKISAVLTYIRQEWGNTAGEITPEQIAHARAEFKERVEPWTEADLQAVPANAELEGAKPAAAPAPAAPGAPAAPAAEKK